MEFLKTVEDKHLLRYCQLYIRQKKIELLLQGIQILPMVGCFKSQQQTSSFKDIDKSPYQIRFFDKNSIEKIMQNVIHQLKCL